MEVGAPWGCGCDKLGVGWDENKLGKFKGCCRGAGVSGKCDAISADGDARAVGIAFLWADLANHFCVSDF